jgi:HTH-type transcriptional regulator, competence development regulator
VVHINHFIKYFKKWLMVNRLCITMDLTITNKDGVVMEFGQYVKEIRKTKGLSLREAAKRSGVSHPYLSQLENGKNDKPSLEIINKLAKGLGVNNGDLILAAGHVDDPFDFVEQQHKLHLEQIKNSDIGYLLNVKEEVYFNKKLLTKEQRKLAIRVLAALFKED